MDESTTDRLLREYLVRAETLFPSLTKEQRTEYAARAVALLQTRRALLENT